MKSHKFNLLKNAWLWASIAVMMCVFGIFVFAINMQFSEEFTGGINMSLNKQSAPEGLETNLHNYLGKLDYTTSSVYINQKEDQLDIKVNAKLDSDEQVAELSKKIQEFLVEEHVISSTEEIIGQSVIGPSVGKYMQTSAIQAFVAGLILMVIYILFSFGKIRKDIPAQILAFTTLAVLVVEVTTCFGAYGLRMMINDTIQVDTVFIIAILTVCGYGVNDIIIIFDRVRENLLKERGNKNLNIKEVIENSLWQTMRRSIGTCLSTSLVLVTMWIFGTGVLKAFAFTVGIGVIMTAFSSIFVGGSLTYLMLKSVKKGK